jgi:hypothetical protein
MGGPVNADDNAKCDLLNSRKPPRANCWRWRDEVVQPIDDQLTVSMYVSDSPGDGDAA